MNSKVRIVIMAILVGAILLALFRTVYPETQWTEAVSIASVTALFISFLIEKVLFVRMKDKSSD